MIFRMYRFFNVLYTYITGSKKMLKDIKQND